MVQNKRRGGDGIFNNKKNKINLIKKNYFLGSINKERERKKKKEIYT